jgi:hypothetical protein
MPSPAEYAANRLTQIEREAGSHAPSTHAASEPQDAETAANNPGRKGRARSSMNALRHGLTARVVVLPSEDMDAYKAFSKEIVDSLDAQTPVERQFAQTVADNQWRINRIRSIEDGMLGMGHFESAGDFDTDHPEFHSAMTAARAFRENSKAFVNLSIYEQRLHRSMKESLRQLKELQAERHERRKAEMDDAIRLRKTEEMKGLPYDPAADGFVYASAEIEREQHRRERLHLSKIAEQSNFDLAPYDYSRSHPPELKAA